MKSQEVIFQKSQKLLASRARSSVQTIWSWMNCYWKFWIDRLSWRFAASSSCDFWKVTCSDSSHFSPFWQKQPFIFSDVLHKENHTALIWQKEASDKSYISRKRAKCICHLHWRQWNIMMSYLTYLLVGWVFLHEIWPGRRAHYVNYENINNSNLDGMSLASFCQSRAA